MNGIAETGDLYRYDQLNRLLSSTQYDYRARSGQPKSWDVTNQYGTSYSYDGNGNLLTLNRQAGSQWMDQLTYHYPTPAGGTSSAGTDLLNNRLQHVRDAAPAGVSTQDVDDQAAGNYSYDPVGNLTSDVQGGVRF